MAKADRAPIPLYKVWCIETETEEDAREYGAIDVERAAQIHASRGDDFESTWPMAFMVWDPEVREHFVVVVEREMVPEYTPGKKLPALMSPASHVLRGSHPMCDDPRLWGSPQHWPEGQTWIVVENWTADAAAISLRISAVTCEKCKRSAKSHLQFMIDAGERKAKIDAERSG